MLETLPAHDILYPLILSRLGPNDLFNLRTSSSSLHQLVSVYITLSRSLDLGYNKRANETAFHILTRGAVSLRVLNLSGLKFLTDDLLRPVLLGNPHLTSLDLSECHHLTSGILHTLSSRSYQLDRLILRDCHWVTKDALEYHTLKQGSAAGQAVTHQLTQLSAMCGRVGRPSPCHTLATATGHSPRSNLREIDLTGCWELNDKVLINFVSKFPGLERVILGNIYSITDDCMAGIARFCPDLRALDITGCWRVTDVGMSAVGEYCRGLTDLRVTDCRDVTEQSLSLLRQRGVRVDRQLDPVLLRLLRIRNEQRHARLQV